MCVNIIISLPTARQRYGEALVNNMRTKHTNFIHKLLLEMPAMARYNLYPRSYQISNLSPSKPPHKMPNVNIKAQISGSCYNTAAVPRLPLIKAMVQALDGDSTSTSYDVPKDKYSTPFTPHGPSLAFMSVLVLSFLYFFHLVDRVIIPDSGTAYLYSLLNMIG